MPFLLDLCHICALHGLPFVFSVEAVIPNLRFGPLMLLNSKSLIL